MITFENVTKYYPTPRGRHFVLNDVSFHIPMGSRVGVLGRNGAGKTTLLRLMGGVDTPNSGRIIREGHISWPLGLGAGVQGVMTGMENARFCCRIQGVPLKDISAMVEDIREFSELGKFFDLPSSTYSSGMRGRLKFAIAMAFDFDCYIIDELTATGDKSFRDRAREVFENKQARASFIKVSHGLNELKKECNCGIVLEKGSLRYFEDIDEAAAFYKAVVKGEATMGGDSPRSGPGADEQVIGMVGAEVPGKGAWRGKKGKVKGQRQGKPKGQRQAERQAEGQGKLKGQRQAEGQAERKAQRQAERKAQRQAERQAQVEAPLQGRRARKQMAMAGPPLVTSMGGPLRTSHRPAPMAPRPGKELR